MQSVTYQIDPGYDLNVNLHNFKGTLRRRIYTINAIFCEKMDKKSTYEILKISFSGIINFYILPGVVTGAGVFTARESVHDPEHARSI